MSKIPTGKALEELKEQYGSVYEIEVEDGRRILIKDPTFDFNVMQMAADVLTKERSVEAYASIIIKACYVAGDESVKEDESAISGIAEIIYDLIELPKAEVKKVEENFEITIGEKKVTLKASTRKDRAFAEKKNSADEPYMTGVFLLERLAIDYEEVNRIKAHTPSYISLLAVLDKVKSKKFSAIKKL